MFFPTLLGLFATGTPVSAGVPASADAQWAAVAACPRVVNRAGDRGTGTAVCVACRDGFAYLLTAEHVAGSPEDREVQFFTRESYPRPARRVRGVQVLSKFATPDLAVLKVKVGDEPVPVLRLAGPGERPKRFPFDAASVGCTDARPPTFRGEVVAGKKLARRPGDKVAFFWETAVAPIPGRSGGPLLDREMRVIGICAAAREKLGYYAHLDEILAGLKRDELGWLAAP